MFTKGKWILLLYIFWQLYRSYLHHFCSTDRGTSKRFQVRHSSQCKTTKHQSFHPSFHAPDSHLQPWSSTKWKMVCLISICFKSLSKKRTTSFTITWIHPLACWKICCSTSHYRSRDHCVAKYSIITIGFLSFWTIFFLNVWNDFEWASNWK